MRTVRKTKRAENMTPERFRTWRQSRKRKFNHNFGKSVDVLPDMITDGVSERQRREIKKQAKAIRVLLLREQTYRKLKEEKKAISKTELMK